MPRTSSAWQSLLFIRVCQCRLFCAPSPQQAHGSFSHNTTWEWIQQQSGTILDYLLVLLSGGWSCLFSCNTETLLYFQIVNIYGCCLAAKSFSCGLQKSPQIRWLGVVFTTLAPHVQFFQMFIPVNCLYVQFYTFLLIAYVAHIVLFTSNKNLTKNAELRLLQGVY